ncbi:MAG TPA: antibiotic biosynthesis monooxygenase [Gaiellaceae bacterium]|nr:antibiotic biosynthesis monooxygenase [Gaiellaceae bacterium]
MTATRDEGTEFEVTARLKIRDGELEGFKQQAAEIMRLTREHDRKTLRYDWFLSDDGTQCEVREGYVDADGLLEHNDHVKEARGTLFRDHAYGHDMTIYGEPSSALAELIERMSGHVTFNRYSLLQGLGPDRPLPDGRTATFEAIASLRIRAGRLEGFERQAAELMRQMQQQEAKPLRYDWFLRDDGTECEVREVYESADALLEHQRPIAEAKLKLFREFVDGHSMSFYDEPSPALTHALEAMGTPYRRFALFQGLDVRSEVLDEVRA